MILVEDSVLASAYGSAFLIYMGNISGGDIAAAAYTASVAPNLARTSSTWNDGNWHFLAITADYSLGIHPWTIYVDGTNQTITYDAASDMTSETIADYPIYIAARNNSIAPFDGSMTDPRVYTVVLSSNSVSTLYNNNGSTCP